MKTHPIIFCSFLLASAIACVSQPRLIQHGTMHESLGEGRTEGRVLVADVVAQPNFYGVGAAENLNGEITIFNSEVIHTTVDGSGQPKTSAADETQTLSATLLVGNAEDSWHEIVATQDFNRRETESWIKTAAQEHLLKPEGPFVFRLAGSLSDVRMHVINGACPMRARMNKTDLTQETAPFEGTYAEVDAQLVGVFAENSVGNLTHPDTTIHSHIVLQSETGELMTGHVEDFRVLKGSRLFLPKE